MDNECLYADTVNKKNPKSIHDPAQSGKEVGWLLGVPGARMHTYGRKIILLRSESAEQQQPAAAVHVLRAVVTVGLKATRTSTCYDTYIPDACAAACSSASLPCLVANAPYAVPAAATTPWPTSMMASS